MFKLAFSCLFRNFFYHVLFVHYYYLVTFTNVSLVCTFVACSNELLFLLLFTNFVEKVLLSLDLRSLNDSKVRIRQVGPKAEMNMAFHNKDHH